jgi:hypothetical protein
MVFYRSRRATWWADVLFIFYAQAKFLILSDSPINQLR